MIPCIRDHVIVHISDHVILYIHNHVIPYTVPSEPTNVTAVALSHSRVRVTWGPVSDDGGGEVDLYKLVVTGPGLSSSNAPEFPPSMREYIIEGLMNNTVYM